MRIFVSEVPELFARGVDGSEAARALLRYAVKQAWNVECPRIEKLPNGKPYFPDCPDKYFSFSHSKSHVLVALSEHDVGADVETLRDIKGRPERLFSPEMLLDFGYFGGWTLRESVFKLVGRGSLRNMELKKDGEEIIAPFDNVRCRLYETAPGYVAAVACCQGAFPEKIEIVDAAVFWA